MGEIDTKTWIEGARYVARLRRRIWQCQLGMVAALLFMAPFFAIWHELKPHVHGIVIAMFFLAVSACLLEETQPGSSSLASAVHGVANTSSGRFGLAFTTIGASIAVSISVRGPSPKQNHSI